MNYENVHRPITEAAAIKEATEGVLKAAGGSTAGPVRIKMRATSDEDLELRERTNTLFITTGFQHALKAVLSGVADLA